MIPIRRAIVAVAFVALAAFYYHAASEHARVINTSRARADQSGYLWDAVGIDMMRHGSPDALIGERNRMPVYPWLLSWLHDPAQSQDAYFERAKRFNILLSLALLALIAAAARRFLPPLVLASFVLVIAFGYFVFKAGYAQVELLYYTIFFFTFVACCLALRSEHRTWTFVWAAAAGVLMALSQLSKAGALPFAAIFLAACGVRALEALRRRDVRTFALRALAGVLFAVAFLGVMAPYLLNSKRVFGHYFYNVNTTFYVWYDDWATASGGVYRHGDGVGWPTVPPDQIPSMRKYLREHTAAQIADRFLDGFLEIFTVSAIRLGHLKYVVIYIAFGLLLIVSNWRAFLDLVRPRQALLVFLVLYAVVYTLAVSFYKPISGTTLRMLLTHVAPLLFVISCLSVRAPFSDTRWNVAGLSLAVRHFYLLVLAVVAFDLTFRLWPRLMGQFAGY